MKKYLLLLISLTLICFNLFCYNQFFDWNKMKGKMYIEFKPYEDSYYLEKGIYALGTGENKDTIIELYSVTSGKMKELMSLPASETAKFNKFEVIIGRNGDYGLSRRPALNYVFQINKNNVYNMLIDKSFSNILSLWANHYGVNYLNDNSYSNSFIKLKEYVENNKEFLSKYIKNKEYTGEFIKEIKGKIYFKDKLIEKYSNLDIKIIENGKVKKYKNKTSEYYKVSNEHIYILTEKFYKHFENKFKKLDFSEYSLKLSYTDSLFLEGNEFGEYITTSSTNFYYYMLNLSAFITE